MHDPQNLLRLGDAAVAALARRRHAWEPATLAELVRARKELGDELEKLRAESNRLAREAKSQQGAPPVVRERIKELKGQQAELETAFRAADRSLTDYLMMVPNLPADEAPDGISDNDAVVIRSHGEPVVPEFGVRHHADLGEQAGVLDLRRAAKLSGARFSVLRGAGARLHRALASFFLDLHTVEQGYLEYSVPTLVTRETMTGTGQLPKFEEDLFRTSVGDRELYLIPTAEVPLVNLYAGETIPVAELPLALTAHTPCFRSEAGSYGRDTRGIFRLHEFSKVEMVRICRAEDSRDQLEALVRDAEECLQRLELSYRVVSLAAGDLGFSAQLTYDIEVWLPSQQRYREISSCSDCGQFQGRRAQIKVKNADGSKAFAATLNGSGLPIGRTLIALLDQHQQPDGSVRIPPALVPYAGFDRIAPDGSPVSASDQG